MALLAVLGLLLIRANSCPAWPYQDTSSPIPAWALVFRYAQQFLTRLGER